MMISYEVYKLLHIYSLITLIICLSVNTFAPEPKKWARITAMVATLFLFVAGMGLLARTGHSHGEPWPLWVKLKIAIWLVIGIGGPIFMKRMPQHKSKILGGVTGLIFVAIFLVVNK